MINKSKVVKKCRTAMIHRQQKFTFTLAEVLIVIGVIGVVAAITIPTLINTINDKAKKAQTETIEARLLDGLNRYNAMEDGFSKHYESTKEFLDGLSEYYKMNQICDSNEIARCVPYSKIYKALDNWGRSSKFWQKNVHDTGIKVIEEMRTNKGLVKYTALGLLPFAAYKTIKNHFEKQGAIKEKYNC